VWHGETISALQRQRKAKEADGEPQDQFGEHVELGQQILQPDALIQVEEQ